MGIECSVLQYANAFHIVRNIAPLRLLLWFWWLSNNTINGTNQVCRVNDFRSHGWSINPSKARNEERTQRSRIGWVQLESGRQINRWCQIWMGRCNSELLRRPSVYELNSAGWNNAKKISVVAIPNWSSDLYRLWAKDPTLLKKVSVLREYFKQQKSLRGKTFSTR